MCTNIHIHIHKHRCTNIHIHIHTHVHTHMHVCICSHFGTSRSARDALWALLALPLRHFVCFPYIDTYTHTQHTCISLCVHGFDLNETSKLHTLRRYPSMTAMTCQTIVFFGNHLLLCTKAMYIVAISPLKSLSFQQVASWRPAAASLCWWQPHRSLRSFSSRSIFLWGPQRPLLLWWSALLPQIGGSACCLRSECRLHPQSQLLASQLSASRLIATLILARLDSFRTLERKKSSTAQTQSLCLWVQASRA